MAGWAGGERPQFEAAIVAPGAAVEADDERPLRQQRIEIDEVSLGVGQEEAGKLGADGGNAVRGCIGPDALDQPVIRAFEVRKQLARFVEIESQPLVERTSSASAWRNASAKAASSDFSSSNRLSISRGARGKSPPRPRDAQFYQRLAGTLRSRNGQ